ncbi:hypothetical protein RRG08_005018 [Elysia crispata]|uniref:Uncharacterized protein n=1 Tax=Elysia crispata TaxID=231223 RepID=A0AAE1B2W7_9GAST|nr:hypothetical protein RRG08_005018 [Elysia crispata]
MKQLNRQTFSSCSTVGVSIPGGLTPVFYPPVRRDQRPASALAGQASGGVPSGVPSGVPAAVPAAVPTTVYWREPGFMIHGILRPSLWPDLLYKFISSHSPATISFYIHSYFTVVLVLVRKDISPGSTWLHGQLHIHLEQPPVFTSLRQSPVTAASIYVIETEPRNGSQYLRHRDRAP